MPPKKRFTKKERLAALKKASELDPWEPQEAWKTNDPERLIAEIRRRLALPPEQRMDFLRPRKPTL